MLVREGRNAQVSKGVLLSVRLANDVRSDLVAVVRVGALCDRCCG